MTEYNRSEAYDLNLFGTDMLSSAAPAVEAPETEKVKKTVAKPDAEAVARAKAESVAETKQAIKVLAVILVMFSLFSGVLAARLTVYDLKAQAAQKEIELNEAKSENVRLNMALNALMSREKVEEYAVNVLGMQRIQRYQIHYLEDRDGDRVVISGGDTVDAEIKADN